MSTNNVKDKPKFKKEEHEDELMITDSSPVHPTTVLDEVESDCAPSSWDYEQESILPTTIAEEEDTANNQRSSSLASNTNFWKYKPFLKGPKGLTFNLQMEPEMNGHKPLTFRDPATCDINANSYKLNSNTYRVGEGNDITPNPGKLTQLGRDIRSTRERILDVCDRSDDGKANKRKLISRLCRLRRSANHEANKIIFDGLEKERDELCKIIRNLRRAVDLGNRTVNLTDYCAALKREYQKTKVAGEFNKYVDSVLANVNEGDNSMDDSD